jgi:hypothetical protein
MFTVAPKHAANLGRFGFGCGLVMERSQAWWAERADTATDVLRRRDQAAGAEIEPIGSTGFKRQTLARIQDAVGVELVLDGMHQTQCGRVDLAIDEVAFRESDAVLPR